MLAAAINKIREHGVLWCIKRTVREFWHPRFKTIQRLGSLNLLIYWPFAQVGKAIDLVECLGVEDYKKTVFVFYDLDVSPITYDYCWALVLGELKRIELGLEHVHLVLVPGAVDGLRKESEQYEKVIGQHARQWRIYNLLLSMVAFLPTSSGFTYCTSRKQAAFIQSRVSNLIPSQYSTALPNTHSFREELKDGKDLRFFMATTQALQHIDEWIAQFAANRKIITITIRQYDYMPDRNSNISEWRKFIATLDRNEYAVVIVPDLNQAWVESQLAFEDCHNFIPATWNLQLRMALFERAYLNLGINSGPLSLCFLNKNCNYICFKMQTDGVSQTTDDFLLWLGFKIGKSLPFAGPTQKWIWENDDCDIIQREFKLMCEKIP